MRVTTTFDQTATIAPGLWTRLEMAEAENARLRAELAKYQAPPCDRGSLIIRGIWVKELTPRQKQVMQLVAQGNTRLEVAELLGLSLSTVTSHVNAVLCALGCANATEAVGLLARTGLIGY